MTKQEEGAFKIIVESAGAIYRGVQCDIKSVPVLVLFDEPRYKTTLALRITSFTKLNVAEKMRRSASLFVDAEKTI